MKRLTFYDDFNEPCYRLGNIVYSNKIAARLASYEDTGMDPEEISIRRWIPVTERLPGIDDGDWVLGVVNGFAYGIVYKNAIVTVEYYENSGCWSLHDLDAKVTVTHWMPLPEPPEEVTQ